MVNSIPLYGYTGAYHSPVERHLVVSSLGTSVKNATNIRIQVFEWMLSYLLGHGIAESHVYLTFSGL